MQNQPQFQQHPPQQHIYIQQPAVPAKTAHGAAYWLFIGWWWEPTKWLGRMLLWLIPPLGIWRSVRHGQRNREARLRRGAQQYK